MNPVTVCVMMTIIKLMENARNALNTQPTTTTKINANLFVEIMQSTMSQMKDAIVMKAIMF